MVDGKQAVIAVGILIGTGILSMLPVVGWIIGFVVFSAAFYCLAGRWA